MNRVLWLCLILLWGGTRATAYEWPLLSGGLSGDFRMKSLPGVPPIQWRVDAVEESGESIWLTVDLEARGLKFRVQVILPRDGSAGNWRILAGHLDVPEWWANIINSGLMPEMPADLQLGGELQFSGKGNLADATWDGELLVELVGGSMSSADQEWSVQRMNFDATLKVSKGTPILQNLRLTSPRAEVQGFVLENLELSAGGLSPRLIQVQTATVSLLGGEVGLRPFTIDLLKPTIVATAVLDGVALEALASLMPEALSTARGRLSGALEIGWSAELGLQPGTGSLRISHESPSTLRLAATPDFLTRHISKKIEWMPGFLGPLGRWLAVDHPAYETLRKIEMGEMELRVDMLDVALYPDGADGQVSARVAVVARPQDSDSVEEVSFEINVTGPLKEVLLLSTDESVKMGVISK